MYEFLMLNAKMPILGKTTARFGRGVVLKGFQRGFDDVYAIQQIKYGIQLLFLSLLWRF